MRSRFAGLLGSVLLSSALLLPQGCEKGYSSSSDSQNSQNIGHVIPSGVNDVYGSWYKKPTDQNLSWAWNWGNLSLSQNGTALKGHHQWEWYPRNNVEGWIHGDTIHLDVGGAGTNAAYYLDGHLTAPDTLQLTQYHLGTGNSINRTYTKISDEFNDGHDPVAVLRETTP
jgi:hypothetical protein